MITKSVILEIHPLTPNSRSYLNRWIQPDTIVPGGVQGLDRYAYANNNPVKYTDPSGHDRESTDCGPDGIFCDKERVENGRVYHLSTIEVFLSGLWDPLHLGNFSDAYGGFGGCNTLHGCDYGGHPAVDVRGSLGQNVYSAGYGVVVDTGYIEVGFGNYIVIKHNIYGVIYYTVYAHLNKITIKIGDVVDHNTLIGTIGNSGQMNGSYHLHFEARTSKGIDLEQNNSYLGYPFTGKSCPDDLRCGYFWPQTFDELTTYWVDLTPLLWVDYAWDYFNWQDK